jgi:thiol-disulfide isomerase/thioredoxin
MMNRKGIFIGILTSVILFTSVKAQTGEELSMSKLYNKLKSESDPSTMEQILEKMKSLNEKSSTGKDGYLIDISKQYTSVRYAETGEVSKAITIAKEISDKPLQRGTKSAVASALIDKKIFPQAENILKSALSNPIPESEKNRFISIAEETEYLRKLYGKLLYKKGEFKQSLEYLAPAIGKKGIEGSGNAELYALALIKTGADRKAMTEIENVLFLPGEKGAEFLSAAKKLYSKTPQQEKHFAKMLDSASQADQQRLEAIISKKRVSQPSPEFKITNINGKEVSLSGLKGKTIIIDFWATWCIPCVGSFPAMQKAVDYYKGDKDVVFLFVHSFENSATPLEDAKKMMAAKKHSFDVYMDLKDASKVSPMAGSFGVKALPTKVIIDPQGIIRYRESGFIDEGEGLREMKAMIETSRAKQTK